MQRYKDRLSRLPNINTKSEITKFFGNQITKERLEKFYGEKLKDEYTRPEKKNILLPKVFLPYLKSLMGSKFVHINPELIPIENKSPNNSISSLENIDYGHNNEIIMRYNDNSSNLLEIIQSYYGNNIDSGILDNIYESISLKTGINKNDIIDYFVNNNAHTIITIEQKEIVETLFNIISEVINNTLNLCLIFVSKPPGNIKLQLNNDCGESAKMIFLRYSEKTKQIGFDKMLKINVNDNSKNSETIEGPLLNHLKFKILKYKPADTYRPSIIEYNPYDKEERLQVVTIDIKGNNRNFLLGKPNKHNGRNLYEDNEDNKLVGQLIIKDDTTLKCDIFWCKDYIF